MLTGRGVVISISIVIAAVFVKNYKSLSRLKAPIVEVTNGQLQGIVSTSRDGRMFFEYLGIPFAKPPTEELRFEPPEPPEPWEGLRDASEYGSKCLQVDLFLSQIEGDEDCLYLNVHTPSVVHEKSALKKLPVMVWIHGGVFIFGSGIMYRPDYFMDAGVVIVTINYRLGSFGFLNTGDGVIRGNMGLKDQTMALRWIQQNIHHFGGDPDNVLLFGESAGGASAHLHMMSATSRGLFHKVISQSGISSMPWALKSNPGVQAKRFAERLNCTTENTKLMVFCMKSLSSYEVISAHLETVDPLRELVSVFAPTIELNPDEGAFLTDSPENLLRAGDFAKVPFLTGVDSEEGLINAAVIYRNESLVQLLKAEWNKWIPRLLYLSDDTDSTILQQLKEFYLQGFSSSSDLDEFINMTNLFSDRFWNVNFHNGIASHIKHSSPTAPIYLYYYTYPGEFTLTNIILSIKGYFHPVAEVLGNLVKSWVTSNILGGEIPRFGVCHGDELPLQFQLTVPFIPTVHRDHADYRFSKEMVKVWADFARSEPHQTHLEFMGVKWTSLGNHTESLQYLKLDMTPSMISEPFNNRVEFWNSIVHTWHP